MAKTESKPLLTLENLSEKEPKVPLYYFEFGLPAVFSWSPSEFRKIFCKNKVI